MATVASLKIQPFAKMIILSATRVVEHVQTQFARTIQWPIVKDLMGTETKRYYANGQQPAWMQQVFAVTGVPQIAIMHPTKVLVVDAF